MSEELRKKGYLQHGLKIGHYEYYRIGESTLSQLVAANIIPNGNYTGYATRKPDGLVVDRRDTKRPKVIAAIEDKDIGRFTSKNDRAKTLQQCNDLCQILGADVGIATDQAEWIWINPNQPDPANAYRDSRKVARSYTHIRAEGGKPFLNPFVIDQQTDQIDLFKLADATRESLKSLDFVRSYLTPTNSAPKVELLTDPSKLAREIWQDVWAVVGATPEKCLYTFVELFIFKYLSDLGILTVDNKGNKISFAHIYSLNHDVAFRNYSENVRPYLREMFPESPEDGTTIINGTVLRPEVPEHSRVFYKILKRFLDFGELRNIDPRFKSKIFEDFMKESISSKNLGQFFTPRNIVDAMVEMSDIDQLPAGAKVCDPACGVGGFILEPLKLVTNGVNYYYQIKNGQIVPRLDFLGLDKGFEKEEQLTIILAKANMLIFLSELLRAHPTLSREFANLFNATFRLLNKSILGTLSELRPDTYDLILTNPPYVTSGSSNYKETIKNSAALRDFYQVQGLGVESLFLEWIVRCLKPGRKAFVIVPDGIMNRINEYKLRQLVRDECILDAVISLPVNAFYTTPKKTYIVALTKKPGLSAVERRAAPQSHPVFTYLVSDIGETLDVNRFRIDANDLPGAVTGFNQFKGAKAAYKSTSDRCKIQPIDAFDPKKHWSVDRWWTREEKVALGIEEASTVLTLDEFKERIKETVSTIGELQKALDALT